MPTNETTIDHYPVTPGMWVWNYDLRPAKVGDTDHVAQDGTVWYATTGIHGSRGGMFDAKRMWVNYPGTRITAEAHVRRVLALDAASWTYDPDDPRAVNAAHQRLTEAGS